MLGADWGPAVRWKMRMPEGRLVNEVVVVSGEDMVLGGLVVSGFVVYSLEECCCFSWL